ncbi:unnamed protein product [Ambrosiozyma monospora]|uniref:Unnamed protein product n=1 Tax=Ambrosiozyma monospora TaxID=43982 RepID=A0ACB5U2C7_AMBMO|nr:unnamed protein product [Ambrosiozyma monospora]
MTAASSDIQKLTFSNEEKLPHLPLPSLPSTVSQTLAAIKPLISPEQYQHLSSKSNEFLKSDVINIIQQHLEESAKENDNYLDCNGISPTTANVYGELRGNTLPRNPFFILENDPIKSFAPSQQFRASLLTTSALRFIVALRQEQLKPDVSPKSGKPLSMSSYTHLFGSTVVPLNNGVSLKVTEDPHESRHIIVMARSQFYVLEVLSEDNHIWFTKFELANILKEIMEDSKQSDLIDRTRHAVGAFTTELKTTWRLARMHVEKSNKDVLNIIDKALFVLSLDHEAPNTDADVVQFASHVEFDRH